MPDDAYFTDQIFVGLISAAVAWPIRNILQRLFEKANERDDEELESWLVAPGAFWVKLLFGPEPHKLWHFTGKRPVSALVRWMTLHPEEYPAAFVAEAAAQRVAPCIAPPEEEEPKLEASTEQQRARPRSHDSARLSHVSSVSSMQRIGKQRRLISLLGFLGIYVAWTISSWFIFVRARRVFTRFSRRAADCAAQCAAADLWHDHLSQAG